MSLKGGQWVSHITASEQWTDGVTPKMGIPGEYRVETHDSYQGVYRLFRTPLTVEGAIGIGPFDPIEFITASDWTVHMAGRFNGTAASTWQGATPIGWWYHPHSDTLNSASQGSYVLLGGYWAWFKVAGTAYIGALTDISDGESIYLTGEVAFPYGKTFGGTAVTPYPIAGVAVGASASAGQGVKVQISCMS